MLSNLWHRYESLFDVEWRFPDRPVSTSRGTYSQGFVFKKLCRTRFVNQHSLKKWRAKIRKITLLCCILEVLAEVLLVLLKPRIQCLLSASRVEKGIIPCLKIRCMMQPLPQSARYGCSLLQLDVFGVHWVHVDSADKMWFETVAMFRLPPARLTRRVR